MITDLEENKVSFGSIKQKLFTFKELETLLNLRPFTNNKRFIYIKSKDRGFRWYNNCWATDNNCWPISLIKKLTKEGTCYLVDCSRANSKINNVAGEGEVKFEIFLNKKITKKLKTGDYVYIPAGVYHRAVPLTDKRISCSFPIKLPLGGIKEERTWLKIL